MRDEEALLLVACCLLEKTKRRGCCRKRSNSCSCDSGASSSESSENEDEQPRANENNSDKRLSVLNKPSSHSNLQRLQIRNYNKRPSVPKNYSTPSAKNKKLESAGECSLTQSVNKKVPPSLQKHAAQSISKQVQDPIQETSFAHIEIKQEPEQDNFFVPFDNTDIIIKQEDPSSDWEIKEESIMVEVEENPVPESDDTVQPLSVVDTSIMKDENEVKPPSVQETPSTSAATSNVPRPECSTGKPKIKRSWVNISLEDRETQSEFINVCKAIEANSDDFYNYFHMTRKSFVKLHDILEMKLHKNDTIMRRAITPKERLSIFLRFLTTGESYACIAQAYRVGSSTVSKLVREVSKVVSETLQPIYIPTPTEEMLRESAEEFLTKWKFPNCIGALEAKHIFMCPRKASKSVVLLVLVDAFNNFLLLDVGEYGKRKDANIFESTKMCQEYFSKGVLLPPKPLPNSSADVNHVVLGDESFSLQPYLMRPFSKPVTQMDDKMMYYNNRLKYARSGVDEVFEKLVTLFKVYKKPLGCDAETAIYVIKATCCLYNYLKSEQEYAGLDKSPKLNECLAIAGIRKTNLRCNNFAVATRNAFVEYFNYTS